MKCLSCEKFSLHIICSTCLKNINILPSKRRLDDGLKVYSFFTYSDIEHLLFSKYKIFGSRIFSSLSLHAAKYFFTKNQIPEEVLAIGLDDAPRPYFSHTGIIVHEFARLARKKNIPLRAEYGTLKATSKVSYAGKSLKFRQSNPKNFIFNSKSAVKQVILFDDVVTTGSSLVQANKVIKSKGYEVLFALTLANARI